MEWDFPPSSKSDLLSDIATVQALKPQLMPMQSLFKMLQGKQPGRSLIKQSLQLNGRQTVKFFSAWNDDNSARIALQQSVLFETMLNVADVAHAMQSWEPFLFGNRKLFEELCHLQDGSKRDWPLKWLVQKSIGP